MINQGASEISMMFGISVKDAEKPYMQRMNFVITENASITFKQRQNRLGHNFRRSSQMN